MERSTVDGELGAAIPSKWGTSVKPEYVVPAKGYQCGYLLKLTFIDLVRRSGSVPRP